jgi:predicted negative regulator of RcsB-dependent stress response
MAKKEEKKDILESAEAISEKLQGAEHWIEQNPKTLIGIVGAIVIIVGGYFGFKYYQGNQNAQAQKEMFQAVRYFEADSLNLAMKGDGNNLGFEQIIEDYGMTAAGNLANYYAGVISLKQGKHSLAVFYLDAFKASDILVQARAYSLIGDAYMEQKKYEEAASYYEKASDYKPNKFYTPTYLMKLALAYEKLNQNEKAMAAYDRIINDFWDSSEYQTARKYKASLEKNS